MKLSSAILLGSTLATQPLDNCSWNTCLCGVALMAFARHEPQPSIHMNGAPAWKEAVARWPWLDGPLLVPEDLMPEAMQYSRRAFANAYTYMTYLCWDVLGGYLTLEQAVDRVRRVEPPEPEPEPAKEVEHAPQTVEATFPVGA